MFDLGTGLRYFAETMATDELFDGTCLLSHLHWDHVQGLPFFKPLLRSGARLSIHAPAQFDGRHPGEVLLSTIRPPLFPISLDEFNGDVTIHCAKPQFSVGSYTVHSGAVPHNGPMAGYRVERDDISVTYISDHQQPDDPTTIAESVLELCRGVDLLIHDAQYTPSEFEQKRTWGHCTVEYAVSVAVAGGREAAGVVPPRPVPRRRHGRADGGGGAAMRGGPRDRGLRRRRGHVRRSHRGLSDLLAASRLPIVAASFSDLSSSSPR